MEADYKDMLSYCAEKKLATKDLPEVKRAHATEDQKQEEFQNQLKEGLIEFDNLVDGELDS